MTIVRKKVQTEYNNNESIWSKFSSIFMGCYYLEILDGIKMNVPKHQTKQQIFISSAPGRGCCRMEHEQNDSPF